MVICLELGADLHMAQLMPLPLTVSCFSKIQIGFTFLVPAHPGRPGQRAVKRVCVCVCVRPSVRPIMLYCWICRCYFYHSYLVLQVVIELMYVWVFNIFCCDYCERFFGLACNYFYYLKRLFQCVSTYTIGCSGIVKKSLCIWMLVVRVRVGPVSSQFVQQCRFVWTVVSCSADMTVKLWDFHGFECVKTMHG